MRKSLPVDLIITALLAIVCALAPLLGLKFPLLRAIMALPLILILPGFALQSALFPKRSLSLAEQILVIGGSSLMIDALMGLTLYKTRLGLKAGLWAVALCGFTLIFCLIAGLLRQRLDIESSLPFKLNLSWGKGMLLCLAVFMTVGAVSLSRMPVSNTTTIEGYTILWMMPGGNDNPNVFRLGIISSEFTTTRYTLRVTVNNHVGFEWKNIQLAPGEQWETTGILSGPLLTSKSVEALLYKLNNAESIYRQVELWPGP